MNLLVLVAVAALMAHWSRILQQGAKLSRPAADSRRRRIKGKAICRQQGCGVHSGRYRGNVKLGAARLAQASGVCGFNRTNVQNSCQRTAVR